MLLASSIYTPACSTWPQYSYLNFINEESMMRGGACEKNRGWCFLDTNTLGWTCWWRYWVTWACAIVEVKILWQDEVWWDGKKNFIVHWSYPIISLVPTFSMETINTGFVRPYGTTGSVFSSAAPPRTLGTTWKRQVQNAGIEPATTVGVLISKPFPELWWDSV